MADKELKARVNLDTSQAERSLARLSNKIEALNKVVNQANGGSTRMLGQGYEQAAKKAEHATQQIFDKTKAVDVEWRTVGAEIVNVATTMNNVANKTNNVVQKTSRLSNLHTAITSRVKGVVSKVREWWTNQKQVTNSTKTTNNVLGSIWNKLRGIAATYLGIMGTRALIQTSDTITGAQNKLNYVNPQQLGASGVDSSGAYSAKTIQMTQESMDKMYASSQKVRMSYTDMMSNVSKSMTLAGDAFQNSTDNAIRFQEIMAEAYAIGGASAQEMSSSMYQMIQALGAGTLAGDELRSVREGAPLAYQAIEEFVQGVWNSEESLKDLASQGKVTSDMVVAAIMNAGGKMDSAFAKTKVLFDQTATMIANAFKKAFEPVSNMLRDALNKAIENGMIQKIENAFISVSKALQITFAVIANTISWIADNWDWLRYVVVGVLLTICAYLTIMTVVAIQSAIESAKAFILAHTSLIPIVAVIFLIIFALYYLATTSSSVCEFIYRTAVWVVIGICAYLTFMMMMSMVTGKVMLSSATMVALVVIAIIALLLALFIKFTGEIVGCVYGIGAVISEVITFIQSGWQNMCNNLAAWFWNAIADMLDGVDWLLNGINKIREALGMDAISVEGIRAKADSYKAKVTDTLDIGSAWDSGYAKGYAKGEDIQSKINNFGKGFSLDDMGSKLGLDFSGMGAFPNASDPAYDVAGAYNMPDNEDLLKGIKGDTGDISKSMELTDEDLEYLRRIAEMEWKKEFTTANITVDMSNYNTINGENDLDGIVTKLADKLYEEMNVVANGVYA